MYRSQLEQLHREKARLETDLAKERTRIAKLQREAGSLQTTISRTKSASTQRSKERELLSKKDQIAKTQNKIADLEKKIAAKIGAINRKTKSLSDAEARESKRQREAELHHLADVNAELEQQMILENSRQSIKFVGGRKGEPLKPSEDAKVAATRLLEMFEAGELAKESHLTSLLSSGMTNIQLWHDNKLVDFPVPIADVKELNVYGALFLKETRSKGRITGWNMLLLPERLKEIVREKQLPDVFRIFYSWQSWTPKNVNQNFILDIIKKAAKEIRNDAYIAVEPVVDRDTQGEAGSVDIAATIFRKIEESQIFICDTTIITDPKSSRQAPNPNVMIELGYAAAFLGWESIICIVNTAYGNIEKMPFDLRSRRLLTYCLPQDAENKADVRRILVSDLNAAIRVIMEKLVS